MPIFHRSLFRILSASRPLAFAAAALAATLMLAATQALACACCTAPGFRHVEVEPLDAARLAEIAKIRFAAPAKLMLREADDDGLIEDAQENYTLAAARQKDRILFSLRDAKNRAGSFTLMLPKTVSIFEVDPRDGKDDGHGPVLYKEWKLTANASGDSLFRKAAAAPRKMTLILHGRGLACTEAADFKSWTLLIHGRGGTLTFYGTLDAARP